MNKKNKITVDVINTAYAILIGQIIVSIIDETYAPLFENESDYYRNKTEIIEQLQCERPW